MVFFAQILDVAGFSGIRNLWQIFSWVERPAVLMGKPGLFSPERTC